MSRFEREENKKLRDKFAGLAMQGMINYDLIDHLSNHSNEVSKFCELSYLIADLMLEARKNETI